MKKRAALLAMAAMLALTPVAAFAGSDNDVTKTVNVKDDAIIYNGSDSIDAPYLKIENDGADWGNEETFELKLNNAEWLDENSEDESDNEIFSGDSDDDVNAFAVALANEIMSRTQLEDSEGTVVESVYATVERKSDTKVKVTIQRTDADHNLKSGDMSEDLVVKIPMWVEMDGTGEATVEIDSKDGSLTEEAIKFATGADGDTIVTIEDTTDFSNKGKVETIEIEETASGAIDYTEFEYIEFEVTKEFTFAEDSDGNYGEISGDFIDDTDEKWTINATNAKLEDEKLKIYFATDKGKKEAEGDDLASTVDMDDLVPVKAFNDGTGNLEFNGFNVKATKDSNEGKVYITVRSNIDEIDTTKLEMGLYSEWAMTVKADDDPTEIFSGFYEDVSLANVQADRDDKASGAKVMTDSEDHELVKLIIEEDVDGTWDAEKEVSVTLPEWVKIMNVKIEGDSEGKVKETSIDNNEFEFTLDKEDDDKSVELTFYVSVEAGKEGDIEALVSGRALDKEEFKVVLGKAKAPVKIEAEVAKLKAGVRKQELGKITISETAEETIKEGDIIIELDDDIEWDGEPTVKVVKGDLEIDEDDIDVDDNILTIHVDEESDEISVIEITDAEVTADRAIAEGSLEVEVKGDALVRNGFIKNYDESGDNNVEDKFSTDSDALEVKKSVATDEYGFFADDEYVTLEVANVITPADDNVQGTSEAKFVIGQAEFMMGENVVVADVAPYIKDGRTMLSLSFVAKALGVESNNIMWDGETRSVTIFKGDRIAQVQIGSNKLMVNGTPVMMDTAAEIKEGRTMLPVAYVAKALGAEVAWDGATKTVTIK